MRIKVERKIASKETASVRKVKGNGSTCGKPGSELRRIQALNQVAFTHTKVMLPQNPAIFSAKRSVGVRCSLAASSSFVTVSTFFSVNWSADGSVDRFPFGVPGALSDGVPFFFGNVLFVIVLVVGPHSNESVARRFPLVR